uniref:Nuclear speckle splicing regulatory protein 1 N-terminal domain-containing protein n=2 Tax=Chenopodium quinoa TaxID=63459 RepID=A0A803MZF0_CHEQI
MEKAKKREKEHEVVYERKLAKERSKDDHLYADKDKFVTGAYKRKLAEQAKWMEEERLRELREEKDNVTKKSDLTDFYFNLAKNVAFGAEEKSKKSGRGDKESAAATEELKRPEKEADINERAVGNPSTSSAVVSPSRLDDRLQGEAAVAPEVRPEPAANLAPSPPTSTEVIPPPPTDKPKQDHHKKSQEALAAAKERFLARKKAKMEL